MQEADDFWRGKEAWTTYYCFFKLLLTFIYCVRVRSKGHMEDRGQPPWTGSLLPPWVSRDQTQALGLAGSAFSSLSHPSPWHSWSGFEKKGNVQIEANVWPGVGSNENPAFRTSSSDCLELTLSNPISLPGKLHYPLQVSSKLLLTQNKHRCPETATDDYAEPPNQKV